jgi:hypothetical protein
VAHRRGKCDGARIEKATRLEQHVAGVEIESGGPDETLRLHRFADANRVAFAVGVLLDQDRIGAVGNRRPREDAHRLAGFQLAREALASA